MSTPNSTKRKSKWRWFLVVILLVLAIVAIFYFFVRIYHIDSNYIGVKASINNPIDENSEYELSLVNGYVVYVPLLTQLKTYPTSVQTYNLDRTKIYTSDGVEFIVSPKVSLELDRSKADLYYKHYRDDIDKNEFVKEAILNTFKTTASSYSTDSLVHNNTIFNSQLEAQLTEKLKEAYLIVKNINYNLEYPEQVKKQIDLKSQIEQDIIVAETQAKLAYIEANTKRKQDSLEYSVLTNLSIQKMFIDKWDGRLAPNPEQPKAYRDINKDLANANE